MTDARIGLAIVGCGQIVTHHLHAIATRLSGKYQVRALVDPNAQRRQVISSQLLEDGSVSEGAKPAEYDTFDTLLQDASVLDAVQVIFIAVPHDLHKALALQALASNKTVVMEKPLAPTVADCQALVKVSKQLLQQSDNPQMLIIAEQSPHWQEVVLAKRLIRDGAIGHVVSAAAYYYESMRDNVTSGDVGTDGGLGWRGSLQRAGGGIAIDGGLHWIRPLREMCGRIARVVGVTRRNLAPRLRMEGESLGHALFQFDADGAHEYLRQPQDSGPLVGTYSCSMLATAPMAHDACPYFRITGDEGEIIIHGDGLFKDQPGSGGLRLYNEEHVQGKEMFASDRLGGFFLGFAGLWDEIHRICTANDTEAAHETVVRAHDDVMVALSMYKSSKSGQWETTPTA